MDLPKVQVIHSIPKALQNSAFQLYMNEFKGQNANLPITETQLSKLLHLSLDWRFVVAAVYEKEVIGLAGYQSKQGAFTGAATPIKLLKSLGIRTFLTLTRSSIAEYRRPKKSELLHDGLIVSPHFRRQKVATRLLHALSIYAKEQSFTQMRLDVAENNTAAIALYERLNYQVCNEKTHNHLLYRRYLTE